MLEHLRKIFASKNHFPEIAALLGGMAYLVQSVYYAFYQIPILDEGAYLFKGYQFALGTYRPFQPYGFWTNKMYLGFYIWGWIQEAFSPGLLAPRLFAVALGIVTLAGTWIVVRRMGSPWLAALSVWAVALNPTLISIYSLAISQILIICLLTWTLVFILGPNRPFWQIITGSALAAAMIFTRENMVFVIPFLIIYLFVEHGKKKGFYALGVIIVLLILGHLLFWPNILYLWTRQIPNLQTLFSKKAASIASSGNNYSMLTRLVNLTISLRIYLIPLLCSFLALIFWPRKDQWTSQAHKRATIFLLLTYAILLITHAYASAGENYCVSCSTDYFAFFGSLGLILFATSFYSLDRSAAIYQKIISALALIVISASVGLSLYQQLGYLLNDILVPRFRNGAIQLGTVELGQLLQNKFGIQPESSRMLLSTLGGLLLGILFIALIIFISQYLSRENKTHFLNYFIGFLLLPIFLLSPVLDALPKDTLCNVNVPGLYQSMAKKLNTKISSGSKIYLDGSLSAIPLLYLSAVQIYPPQLNARYSFHTNGNTDDLLKKGYWNEELANQWQAEADYFIVSANRIKYWEEDLSKYHIIYNSVVANPGSCPSLSGIYVFTLKH